MWMKLAVTLLLSTPAWGYRFTTDFMNGFYWSSLPVSITVVESDPTLKSKLEYLSRSAIAEWETTTGLKLWSNVATGTNNIIRWSNNFANETRMDAGSVLAVAIRYTNGPYFAKTEIIINGSHPYNQQNNLLLTTITHELGHTLGLDHSDAYDAIMAPSLQMTSNGVRQDDILGMKELVTETRHRQAIGYVSPLSYEKEEKSSSPLSCGTVAVTSGGSSAGALVSLMSGILIGFVRRIWKGLKKLF